MAGRSCMFAVVIALVSAGQAFAVQPDEILPDAALESRARALSAGLRCLVCQNQSIDDSDAPLARDLRLLVRERLKAGDADDQVVDYVVKRYGAFVLLKPPFETSTVLLWIAPFLLLLGGLVFVWSRRPVAAASAADLSPEEQAQVAAILARQDETVVRDN